jgi:enoyl reductase-like protein
MVEIAVDAAFVAAPGKIEMHDHWNAGGGRFNVELLRERTHHLDSSGVSATSKMP